MRSMETYVRGNNRAWASLYYDELVDRAAYQLSYVGEAGIDGFYNCAQAVRDLDAATMEAIETFYRDRGLEPAVYVDAATGGPAVDVLLGRGYGEVPEEEELWHILDLSTVGPAEASDVEHGGEPSVKVHVVSPGDERYEAWLRVNATANELPPTLSDRVRRHLDGRAERGVEGVLLLATVAGAPASTTLLTYEGGDGYLAESGTLAPYRRRGLHELLKRRCIALAREAGCAALVSTTSTVAHSGPACQKLGFVLAGRRRYFRQARP